MRAKMNPMENDVSDLMCSESGCGRRWSTNIERPLCSIHNWGRDEGDPVSTAGQFSYRQHHTGDKAWAHRIIERHKARTSVTETALAMAKRALGLIE